MIAQLTNDQSNPFLAARIAEYQLTVCRLSIAARIAAAVNDENNISETISRIQRKSVGNPVEARALLGLVVSTSTEEENPTASYGAAVLSF